MFRVRRWKTTISKTTALEEVFFLGLRLNRGVDLRAIRDEFGWNTLEAVRANIEDLVEQGLIQLSDGRIILTARGRLLSNEVFNPSFIPLKRAPASKRSRGSENKGEGKQLGRPRRIVNVDKIAALRAKGNSWSAIADQLDVGLVTLYRHCATSNVTLI